MAFAVMTDGHYFFYATAATVIPVFWLAYIVWARTVTKRIIDRTIVRVVLNKKASRLDRWLPTVVCVIGGILCLFPLAAEVLAFVALSRNAATSVYVTVVSIGLAMSAAMVLMPVAYNISGLPSFLKFFRLSRELEVLAADLEKREINEAQFREMGAAKIRRRLDASQTEVGALLDAAWHDFLTDRAEEPDPASAVPDRSGPKPDKP